MAARPPAYSKLRFHTMVINITELVKLKPHTDPIDSLVFHLTNPKTGGGRLVYDLVAYKSFKKSFALVPDLVKTVGNAGEIGSGSDGVDINLSNYNFNFDLRNFPAGAETLQLVPILGDDVTGTDYDKAFNSYVRYRKDFYDKDGKPVQYNPQSKKITHYYSAAHATHDHPHRQRYRLTGSGTGFYLNPSPPA